MTSLDISPAAIKKEAASVGTEACWPSVQDGICDSPRTPVADPATPALTPSSEYSEPDLLTPSTPGEFGYSPSVTPTKIREGAHFAQTCIPLKIQLRSSEDDRQEQPPKVSWDISLDSTTTSCRLFDYKPPPVLLKREPVTKLSLSFTAEDFNFSAKGDNRLYQRSRSRVRTAPPSTPAKLQSAPAVAIAASLTAQSSRSKKSGGSETVKPLENVLIRLLPPDILMRLTDDIGRCVAETSKKPIHRCKNRPLKQGLRASAAIGTLKSINVADASCLTTLSEKLSQTIPQVCCTQGKHVRIAMDALHEVESRLSEAVGHEKVRLESDMKAWLRNLVDFRTTETNSSTQNEPIDTACISTGAEEPIVGALTRPIHQPARLQATKSSRSSHNETPVSSYRPYHAAGSPEAQISVPDLIRQKLHRPLLETETTEGFLYVFWRRGDFGLIKIGYTTHTTDQRLDEWQRQCGGEIEGCHTEDQSSQIRVRNVRRLEALVHAELKDYRKLQLNCRGCRKTHKEWFDVDVALARKVVDKWTNWFLEAERYEDCTGGKLLAMDDAEQLTRLCTPAQLETSPSSLLRPAFGRRRSSGHVRTRRAIGPVDNPWAALAGRKHSWATDTPLS